MAWFDGTGSSKETKYLVQKLNFYQQLLPCFLEPVIVLLIAYRHFDTPDGVNSTKIDLKIK